MTPQDTAAAKQNPATAKVLSDREFVLEHTFQAPASKVFAAYVDPKLIPQWWAQPGSAVRVDKLDARPGGAWRFVQSRAGTPDVVFHGVYREVEPARRLVYTFNVEANPGNEIVVTVELTESGGNTHLTVTNLCVSKQARDAMLRYGAAAGAKVVWDRLAELLARA